MKTLILLFICLALGIGVQAQTDYFRVVNGIPYMPVLANSSGINAPAVGAVFFSTEDSQPYLYTGSAWESICSSTAPLQDNEVDWFRVIEGIPVLPLHNADTITEAADPGTTFYAGSGGLRVSDGSSWKSMYIYATTDNVTVNSDVKMGVVNSQRGMVVIPVLNTEPSAVEAGAFYFDSASSDLRIYDGSAWINIDCGACPPQATGIQIIGSVVDGFTFGGYTYYDKDGRTESAPADYRWFLSADENGGGTATELSEESSYTFTPDSEDIGKYLNLGIKVHTGSGTFTKSDEGIGSVLLEACPPQVTGVMISGSAATGYSFGGYTYYDKDGPTEGAPADYRWFLSTEEGTGMVTELSTESTYTHLYSSSQDGLYLNLGITVYAGGGALIKSEEAIASVHLSDCPPMVVGLQINGTEEIVVLCYSLLQFDCRLYIL